MGEQRYLAMELKTRNYQDTVAPKILLGRLTVISFLLTTYVAQLDLQQRL
jgi:hypothetical protein